LEKPIEYLSKGDVIVINYPFVDASDSKKRPALIVAESGSNIIVCVITSKSGREKEIKLEDEDFRSGKLDLISYIHPNALYTTKKDLVLRKVGSLKDEKLDKVITAIIEILQEPPSSPPSASKALERGKPPKK
jgi:mRNA interferase MazF